MELGASNATVDSCTISSSDTVAGNFAGVVLRKPSGSQEIG